MLPCPSVTAAGPYRRETQSCMKYSAPSPNFDINEVVLSLLPLHYNTTKILRIKCRQFARPRVSVLWITPNITYILQLKMSFWSAVCFRYDWPGLNTWRVQVLRSPKEAFAAAMQSWRERCEKCVCLQGDYIEKWLHFQLPVVSRFL